MGHFLCWDIKCVYHMGRDSKAVHGKNYTTVNLHFFRIETFTTNTFKFPYLIEYIENICK